MSLALPEALFFTGIDWAAETHAVCVMDAGGTIVAGFTIEHSADGIALLTGRLARYGRPGSMPVAIERPNGRLVDLLLEAGHPVVPVSPNAIKTWREGEVLSGAKSDAGDAAVIAEYLRLRQHRLRTAVPYSDETLALRTVVRSRGDLVEMRVAATNQLSALLEAHWPGARAIKTWREGEVLSGAKSDAGDAAVIAEYLRLRQHRLRTAVPYSDETLALRTVVRSRGDLVEMRVAATNQLSALLEAHWPGARAI